MKIDRMTILTDNMPGCAANGSCSYEAEWGLSIYIEYRGKKILLDTGASGLFAENAEKLGISIADVDFGVLSHAHYDHADGLETFFEINKNASFYLSGNAKENCYYAKDDELEYDGIKKGTLEKYADRFIRVNDLKYRICDGVTLLGHSTPGLAAIGKRVGQYIMENSELVPDGFAHEQSLILETEQGLVVLNSCSHAGVDAIIKEVMAAFPGRSVYAMIGGFHMFRDTEQEVREHAQRIKEVGTRRIVTGHCTGAAQYLWLKNELEKDSDIVVEQMCSGREIII